MTEQVDGGGYGVDQEERRVPTPREVAAQVPERDDDEQEPQRPRISDLSVEEQAQRWRKSSRAHESRARDLAKQLDAIQAERDALKQSSMTEQERAIEAAREAGRQEALAQASAGAVRYMLGHAMAGLDEQERSEVMARVNLGSFLLEDGTVDEEGVARFAERINPPKPKQSRPVAERYGHGETPTTPSGVTADALMKML